MYLKCLGSRQNAVYANPLHIACEGGPRICAVNHLHHQVVS